ncbi:MAG: HEAT repeat domain-containing protein [Planctomycetota bacterium]
MVRCCWLLLALGAILSEQAVTAADFPPEAELIALLTSESTPKGEQALACKQLAVFGTKDCVDSLAPLLRDPELTSWARIALEAIEDPAAADALRESLTDVKGLPLVGVINSLGVKKSPRDLPALAVYLDDADEKVAVAACLALGKIGGGDAASALVAALGNQSGPIASAAAEGLIRCAEGSWKSDDGATALLWYQAVHEARLPKQRQMEALRGMMLCQGAEGLTVILEALQSDDERRHEIALMATREIKGIAVAPALLDAYEQVPAGEQARFVMALGDRGDPSIVPLLLGLVDPNQDVSIEVRLAALSVLTSLGDVSAIESLLPVAVLDNAILSEAALTTLGSLPGDDVSDDLVRRLGDGEGAMKRALLRLIGMRRVDALDSVLQETEAEDLQTRLVAIESLGNIATVEELPKLIELATAKKTGPETEASLQSLRAACVRMPDQAACAAMLDGALAGSDAKTQTVLLETLAAMGGVEALEKLGEAAKSSSLSMQDTATRLLGGWMSVDAGPVLIDIAKNSSHPYRIRAARGYLRLVRQFVMKQPQRNAMTKAALEIAERVEEKKLVLDAARRYPSNAMLQVVSEIAKNESLQEEAHQSAVQIAAKLRPSPQVANLLRKMGVPKSNLKITSANYGAGEQVKDVTRVLQQAVVDGLPMILLSQSKYNAAFGGDPAPGQPKQLKIEYVLNGQSGSVVLGEDAPVVIP